MSVTYDDDRDYPQVGVKCVFAYSKHCPTESTTYTICKAIEKIPGVSCYGAQERAGLWRIQTWTAPGRIKLLAGCFVMEGKRITVYDKNPLLRGDVEDDDPSTMLTIDGLPFSYGNEAIDRHLESMGVKLRTKIKNEYGRDLRGHVCDYRTGRRTVWINLPEKPLPKNVKIGNFKATLFHWEQKEVEIQCRKCLQYGHKANLCKNEEVCLQCGQPGHRKGSDKCKGSSVTSGKKQAPWAKQNPTESPQKNKPAVVRVDECEECGILGHSKEDEQMCPLFKRCEDCQEEGHESGDLLLCMLSKLCQDCGQDGHEKGNILCIHYKEPETNKECGICGVTGHHESDLECMGTYPKLPSHEDNIRGKETAKRAEKINKTPEAENENKDVEIAPTINLETNTDSQTVEASTEFDQLNLAEQNIDDINPALEPQNALGENLTTRGENNDTKGETTNKCMSVELYSIFRKNVRISPASTMAVQTPDGRPTGTKRVTTASSPDELTEPKQQRPRLTLEPL